MHMYVKLHDCHVWLKGHYDHSDQGHNYHI